jgi:hypothetical protein
MEVKGLQFVVVVLLELALIPSARCWPFEQEDATCDAATTNWTVVPENWQAIRTQWEYSHAVNAVLTYFAFISVAAATQVDRGRRSPSLTGRREPAGVR